MVIFHISSWLRISISNTISHFSFFSYRCFVPQTLTSTTTTVSYMPYVPSPFFHHPSNCLSSKITKKKKKKEESEEKYERETGDKRSEKDERETRDKRVKIEDRQKKITLYSSPLPFTLFFYQGHSFLSAATFTVHQLSAISFCLFVCFCSMFVRCLFV